MVLYPGKTCLLSALEWSEVIRRCSVEKRRLKRMAWLSDTHKLCTLTVGVWVLWMLSREGAWCHRRSIALETGGLHSNSNFSSNFLGDLETISSLLWVSSVKWRIREDGSFQLYSSAIWRENSLDLSETKGRTYYLSCYEEGEIGLTAYLYLGWKRWNLIRRSGLEKLKSWNCFLNPLILFVIIVWLNLAHLWVCNKTCIKTVKIQ